jgi:clan AA aspartic protease
MITGVVTTREARISILVKGREQLELEINAVVDTGYTGSLTLPPSHVAALKLSWQKVDRGLLADGSECLFDVIDAEVEWDGEVRSVLIDEADTDPLVGMSLLSGYELNVEVCPQGKVEIAPLRRSDNRLS